jgi:hypothetical protein
VIFFEAKVRPVPDTNNTVRFFPPRTVTVIVRFGPAFGVAASSGFVKPIDPIRMVTAMAAPIFFQ